MSKRSVCGVILAGGASRRMGTPKEMLDWGGQPLILHLVKSVLAAEIPCLVIANQQARLPVDTFKEMGVQLSADIVFSSGPISGFCTAFRLRREEVLLFLSCDLPFVDQAQIDLLLAKTEQLNCWDAVVPETEGRMQPLFALYHRRTQDMWEEAHHSGALRITRVVEKLRVNMLPEGYLDYWTTFNMNTPEEYRHALQERKRRDALSS
ncbi:molybdenum cofactor guanylyltransferase [Brevibacillus humidisoli]|uniref:molybdenum cofactor guanylyltransferase n=1 Tax=Brevibacillus humidisoli TaxID=2895522 RepID=UPI001E39DB79|nr:molybdenum cofactor guanylyltransferase [Brevibacillus humidisoli]UFJ42108.1 molybdenum cofactor guanylyltransferase [Brevibacillus humidisoli]